MREILLAKEFLKDSAKLPKETRRKLDSLVNLIAHDQFHPLLHTKSLEGRFSGYYSFRITRDWRVIFRFASKESVQLIRVAHRKDIYR